MDGRGGRSVPGGDGGKGGEGMIRRCPYCGGQWCLMRVESSNGTSDMYRCWICGQYMWGVTGPDIVTGRCVVITSPPTTWEATK